MPACSCSAPWCAFAQQWNGALQPQTPLVSGGAPAMPQAPKNKPQWSCGQLAWLGFRALFLCSSTGRDAYFVGCIRKGGKWVICGNFSTSLNFTLPNCLNAMAFGPYGFCCCCGGNGSGQQACHFTCVTSQLVICSSHRFMVM